MSLVIGSPVITPKITHQWSPQKNHSTSDHITQHITPKMDLLPCCWWGDVPGRGMVMYLCPTSLVFFNITFERTEIFQHGLFNYIMTLHVDWYTIILFNNSKILSILARSCVTSLFVSCTSTIPPPVMPLLPSIELNEGAFLEQFCTEKEKRTQWGNEWTDDTNTKSGEEVKK